MKPIIEIRNLSKKYRIGIRQPYYSLRDTLMGVVKNPFAGLKMHKNYINGLAEDEFWAVKDITIKIMPGEVIGIIGRNGAGKSTLLKLLSQITPPTKGEIILRGRIASLLEVGTGFHPELTGRENIFLNGAILGMKQKEIKKRFDQIVDFAEVDKFLDTPVKRYSSGMYMRLAFAVAAHLNPEILLVDEVLSVGDFAFQKKCLGKIEQVSRSGRTVLFISHNTQALTRLCNRLILLDEGKLVREGTVDDVMQKYLQSETGSKAQRIWNENTAFGNEYVQLLCTCVVSSDGKIRETIDIRTSIYIELEYTVITNKLPIVPAIQLSNEKGIIVFTLNDPDEKLNTIARKKGKYITKIHIPGNLLSEGSYSVRIGLATYEPWKKHVTVSDAIAFYIKDSIDGNTSRGKYVGTLEGVVRPLLKWETFKS